MAIIDEQRRREWREDEARHQAQLEAHAITHCRYEPDSTSWTGYGVLSGSELNTALDLIAAYKNLKNVGPDLLLHFIRTCERSRP